jgi:hypothetical protein
VIAAGPAYDRERMSPVLLLILLAAALLALIPVWRLRVAGWPARWLAVAWVAYAGAIVFAIRAPAASRFMVPMLVLSFVAPFVAGPERLTRVLRGRGTGAKPVINVTPRRPPGLPDGGTGDPDPGVADGDDADDGGGD